MLPPSVMCDPVYHSHSHLHHAATTHLQPNRDKGNVIGIPALNALLPKKDNLLLMATPKAVGKLISHTTRSVEEFMVK